MASSQPPLKPVLPIINWGNPITASLLYDLPIYENGGKAPSDIAGYINKPNVKNTFTGAPTWVQTPLGTALKFNGTSDGVTSATSSTLVNQADNFTMEVWWNASTLTAGTEYVMMSTENTTDNAGVCIETINGMQILINGISRTPVSFTPVVNTLYQSVLRRQSGTLQMFMNSQALSTTVATAPNMPCSNINVGCSRQNSTTLFRFFAGTIYLARYWNRAITSTEISLLYLNPWRIYRTPNFTPYYNSNPVGGTSFNVMRMMMGMGM